MAATPRAAAPTERPAPRPALDLPNVLRDHRRCAGRGRRSSGQDREAPFTRATLSGGDTPSRSVCAPSPSSRPASRSRGGHGASASEPRWSRPSVRWPRRSPPRRSGDGPPRLQWPSKRPRVAIDVLDAARALARDGLGHGRGERPRDAGLGLADRPHHENKRGARVNGYASWLLVGTLGACLAGCLCPSGEVLCDGQCVDVATNHQHCGACGLSCPTGCFEGRCLSERPCTADDQCSDGLVCNGVERCDRVIARGVSGEVRGCGTSPSVVCDDGLMCTRDRCNEPTGECTSVPDDALCGGGTCDGPGSSGCTFPCEVAPCRVTPPQCGCAEGDACYVSLAGENRCFAEGTVEPGGSCDGDSDCLAGTICFNRSLDAARPDGRCFPVCADASDCPSGPCVSLLATPTELLSRCAPACAPTNPTACGRDSTCLVFEMGPGQLWAECMSYPGTAGQGEPCTTAIDCAAGNVCIRTSSGLRCLEWCRTDRDCSSGRNCGGLSPEIVVDGVTYGVCL